MVSPAKFISRHDTSRAPPGPVTPARSTRRLSFAPSARLDGQGAEVAEEEVTPDRIPYLSHAGFLGAAKAFPEHRFAVAGVCRDGSVTNRPGARFGLRAIRAASHMLHDATHPCFDVSPTPFLGDAGDLALPNTSLEAMRTAMHVHKAPLIAAHERVWRGGDHSITLLEALNALPFVGMDSVAVASV